MCSVRSTSEAVDACVKLATEDEATAAVDAAEAEAALAEMLANLTPAQTKMVEELFVEWKAADGKGIAPVHWLCGSPAVTESHLMALLDADATLARCRDSRGILPLHWLCANDAVTAEMLLVLIEADEDDDGVSSAAVTADAFGQLPLHWLCGSGSRDARALELLIDANPAALDVHDRHGLMPVHWLCNNAACTGEALAILFGASPESAREIRRIFLQLPSRIPGRSLDATRATESETRHAPPRAPRGGPVP